MRDQSPVGKTFYLFEMQSEEEKGGLSSNSLKLLNFLKIVKFLINTF